MAGESALRPTPKDRWDTREFFDPDRNRPGKSYVAEAAWLDLDLRSFDESPFGISPREAAVLDPQQRLLLESTWEAFEDAGLALERVRGSATSVFIGAFNVDSFILHTQPHNRVLANANTGAGISLTMLSNRISHAFDLRGPSLTLDTACSSSLVAVHYACASLAMGEADLALAGGVNVMLRPELPIILSKGQFLSPHGRCRAFDEGADGYARGEGAGVFLIKRYEDALRDGDRVLALIRASAVNQDGHTDGISLPSPDAQRELLERVYAAARVVPAELDYVEAHGTGTPAGDPIEARALAAALARHRPAGRPLRIGSVKTNVGHLEAAAGVAGLLKAIGVLRFRQIPKNLHFGRPNPNLSLSEAGLEVVAEPTRLPDADSKPSLFVGVNSFGYGGTNAHVVLESAPSEPPRRGARAPRDGRPTLVPLSARSPEALRDLASRLAFELGSGSIELGDVAFSLAFHRSHLEHRAAIVAMDIEDLREQLGALAVGETMETIARGEATHEPEWVFAYTGMGPQWWGMGRELFETDPLFAAAIDDVDRCFRAVSGWSVRDAMLESEASSRMHRTDVAQPASFALQVALTRCWLARGVRAAAIVGHSGGEVAAAHAAGVYTLEDSARIIYHRSRLQQTLALQGGMLALAMPRAEAELLIAPYSGVSIAAVNSWSALTLSGDKAELEAIASELEARGVFHRFLRVEVAYHSPQMDAIETEMCAALAELSPREPNVPLYSSAFGQRVPAAAWGPRYWWQSSREPVLFAHAVQSILESGLRNFLEVGPHPVLVGFIEDSAAELGHTVNCVASLERKVPDSARLARATAATYAAGQRIDFVPLLPKDGQRIELPRYPWQRQPLWIESERSRMDRLGLPGAVYLNRSVLGVNDCWDVELNRNYFPFLHDHALAGETVFPGMGYVEAALALHRRLSDTPGVRLANVSFDRLLAIDPAKLQRLIVRREGGERFSVESRVEGDETPQERHAHGRFYSQPELERMRVDLEACKASCPERVSREAFYRRLSSLGLNTGPWFRLNREIWVGKDCFFVKMDASRVASDTTHPFHATLLDAALQPVLYCTGGSELCVPRAIGALTVYARPSGLELCAFGRIQNRHNGGTTSEVWLTETDGTACAHVEGLLSEVLRLDRDGQPNLWHDISWVEAPIDRRMPIDPRATLIVTDGSDARAPLAALLCELLPESRVLTVRARGSGFDRERWSDLLATAGACTRLAVVILALWDPELEETPLSVTAETARTIGLLQALMAQKAETDVTFVTRGVRAVAIGDPISSLHAAACTALGLVAANECDALRYRSIDLGDESAEQSAREIARELSHDTRGEIAYRKGVRFQNVVRARADGEAEASRREPRSVVRDVSVDEPVELRVGDPPELDSLCFRHSSRSAPRDGEIEIRVERAALNFKDLLKARGALSPIALENVASGFSLGHECVGRVVRAGRHSRFRLGERVVALQPRSLATYLTLADGWAERVPASLGLEACAIPIAYVTAYRALVDLANVQPGERVLIHSATGGLGQALMDVARSLRAEVWATAGSEARREFLRGLGVRHVFSSRDREFEASVRDASEGRGMDVVVGALHGHALHASLTLLASGGRYIDVGKRDIVEDSDLPMRAFNKNLTYAALDIDRLSTEAPALVQTTLRRVLELFERGSLRVGTTHLVAAKDVRVAFETMRDRQHLGKLLVDFANGTVPVVEDAAHAIAKREGSYVVTGGTSGFGATIARWLAEQGAGKLFLWSRSGPAAPGAAELASELEAAGARVEILAVDVCRADAVHAALARAREAPFELRGVMHGAMVLEDERLDSLREEAFLRVFSPKVTGALNLVQALKSPRELDFLVFHSSVAALVGNPGQASYAAANATLDTLAESLRARGYPALSVSWGALAESGVIARDARLEQALATAGVTGVSNRQALAILAEAMTSGAARVGAFAVDWETWCAAHPKLVAEPRLAGLFERASTINDRERQTRRLLEGRPIEERRAAIRELVTEAVAKIIKLEPKQISPSRKLNQLGLDSLMVLELSVALQRRTSIRFSSIELLKGPSLEQLTELLLDRLWPSDRAR